MTRLDREAIAGVDRSSMLGDVLAQPAQLEDALWRVESAALPRSDAPGGLVVCGMGGSAIGADLARACLGERAGRPVRVVRDYSPGPGLGPDTMVLCASYSGETEETLACYEAAGAAGAPRVVLTTGGALADAARADGVPVIGVPSGFMPRAAVAYMTVGALECAALCGAGPSLRGEVEAAARLLERLAEEWGPDEPEGSLSKDLAHGLNGTVPVIYAAGAMVPVARRWKAQLNENAKVPAFFSEVPEANHNEACALEAAGGLMPLTAVGLQDRPEEDRLFRRTAGMLRLAREGELPATGIAAHGETPVERVMSLVLLGDLVSVYVAALRGVDPTRVDAIERFKRMLEEWPPQP